MVEGTLEVICDNENEPTVTRKYRVLFLDYGPGFPHGAQPHKEIVGEESLLEYFFDLMAETMTIERRKERAREWILELNGSGHLSKNNVQLSDQQAAQFRRVRDLEAFENLKAEWEDCNDPKRKEKLRGELIQLAKDYGIALVMKKYLRVVPVPGRKVVERYVIEVKDSVQWVDSPNDATADYREAAEVTQQKIKEQLGLETSLVEIRDPHLMQSKWVISKEDS